MGGFEYLFSLSLVKIQLHALVLRLGVSIVPEGNLSRPRQCTFKTLRASTLKTARAWAIKTLGMQHWHYVSRTWAENGWKQWYAWAIRSRLAPIKKVARTITTHLWGILNAVLLQASNGASESMNSRI